MCPVSMCLCFPTTFLDDDVSGSAATRHLLVFLLFFLTGCSDCEVLHDSKSTYGKMTGAFDPVCCPEELRQEKQEVCCQGCDFFRAWMRKRRRRGRGGEGEEGGTADVKPQCCKHTREGVCSA